MTKFDDLQHLAKDYGNRSITQSFESKRLGHEIIDRLPDFLGCDKANVRAIPPHGPISTEGGHNHEAFSNYGQRLLNLQPIEMGVGLRLNDLEDDGYSMLRSIVSMSLKSDGFSVAVGSSEDTVRVSLAFKEGMHRLLDQICLDFEGLFQPDLSETERSKGVGFHLPSSP